MIEPCKDAYLGSFEAKWLLSSNNEYVGVEKAVSTE